MANEKPAKRGCRSGLGRPETVNGHARRSDSGKPTMSPRRRRERELCFFGPVARTSDVKLDPATEMVVLRTLGHALQEELDCVKKRLRELEARTTVH